MSLPSQEAGRARGASAVAFVHSLNILIKYSRMYGFDHKRTESAFETTWKELQAALPVAGSGGLLLGVNGNRILLDGLPLDTGQAERSFAQLLGAAGLASIHFAPDVTDEDLARLVRAFALGGSKAQDLSRQIKESLGSNDKSRIRVNEVKFVAADPLTGDVSVAAQIAAQTLGPEFKAWLNDPQKLLQLIAASEGSNRGGGGTGPNLPPGSVPMGSSGTGASGSGSGGSATGGNGSAVGGGAGGTGGSGGGGGGAFAFGGGFSGGGFSGGGPTANPGGNFVSGLSGATGAAGTAAAIAYSNTVPLQEEEVVQAIRLLTQFGEASKSSEPKIEQLQQEIDATSPNARLNLQGLLSNLAATVGNTETDSNMLMKAAEHMAIKFALEKYQKGDIKVNAVHQILEHMSRQMERLRQILRLQEDKMGKAGLLVESHADIMDRMFWAEVPESGKKSVLLSNEAACVPARNVKQFLDTLIERGDAEATDQILRNYLNCLGSKDAEIRRKTAIGLSQLSELYASVGKTLLIDTIRRIGEQVRTEQEGELQSLMSAAFVRLSQEASVRRQYGALEEVLESLEAIAKERPLFAKDMAPRIGVENRLPEFIDEALRLDEIPNELIGVFKRTSEASVEHLADRFYKCMTRQECDRVVDLVNGLGSPALEQMRQMLRLGQPSKAASVVGLLSRLDVPTLLELLPARMSDMNRFYQDMIVRQIAYGAAVDRGHTLLEFLELLDPSVLPMAVDEIGMTGDRTTAGPCIAMAQPGDAQGRSPFLQLKALETLGRLREIDSTPILRGLLDARKMFKWTYHREIRIAAAQALAKIDPRYGSQIMSETGLEAAELALAPLEPAPACPWVRQRRYERLVLAKAIPGVLSSSWGKCNVQIREMSMGGGLATKEDSVRISSEGTLEFSVGMRSVKAQVILRRAKQQEFGYEIVNIDLEGRSRIRKMLVDSISKAPETRGKDWDGNRKA